MSFVQAMILAIVEGVTEYLPVSSTGHIILSSWAMGIVEDPFVKDFTVMVQFGAIVAVLVLYWREFLLNFRLYPKVLVAFLPAAILGLMVKDHVDQLLGNVWVVGASLLVGGILLILTDRWIHHLKVKVHTVDNLSLMAATRIGLFQCLAFVPGVSRAAATIWGGLAQGVDLVTATRFSFFLAVPTLTGAGTLKLIKAWPSLTGDQISLLAWGNLVSFLVGILAIRFFVRLVAQYGLKYFGIYRIILGLIVLITLAMGHDIEFL